MKILVLSDSHKKTDVMSSIIQSLIEDVKAIIHLGDCFDDMKHYKAQYPGLDFYCVRGNCDFSLGSDTSSELVAEIGGKRILITHGHKYHVKHSYNTIVFRARELNADICLFGHTHIPCVFYDEERVFLNPGSISLPRFDGFPTYGVLDITGSVAIATVVEINKEVKRIIY